MLALRNFGLLPNNTIIENASLYGNAAEVILLSHQKMISLLFIAQLFLLR